MITQQQIYCLALCIVPKGNSFHTHSPHRSKNSVKHKGSFISFPLEQKKKRRSAETQVHRISGVRHGDRTETS